MSHLDHVLDTLRRIGHGLSKRQEAHVRAAVKADQYDSICGLCCAAPTPAVTYVCAHHAKLALWADRRGRQ